MSFGVTWQDGHTKKVVSAISPKQTEYRRVDPYLYLEEATYGPEDSPGWYSHREGPEFTRVLQSAETLASTLISTG